MTKYICVTSGKGGVGKTTTAVNLASSLQKKGADVVLVDTNTSTPNVHVHLGATDIDDHLHDAIRGKIHASELMYKHVSGLRIIPAVTELQHLMYPDHDGLKEALIDLEGFAEIVVLDGAPGFGKEAIVPIEVADEIIIVTTPDPAAIEDASKCIEVCKEINKHILGVVLNKVRRDSHEHTIAEVKEELGYPVIATIPHDHKVRSSWKQKHPVVHIHPKSKASVKYYALASQLLGDKYAENLKKQDKKGMEGYMLKNVGL